MLPEHLVAAITDAKYTTDLGSGVWEQVTLADFLASGEMDRHIRRMTTRYRTLRDRLVAEFATRLSDWTMTGTAAGLHLVVHPPAGDDEDTTTALAQQSGVDARPLSQYAISRPDRPGLVIGYGHHRPDALISGVIELARLTRSRQARSRAVATPTRPPP